MEAHKADHMEGHNPALILLQCGSIYDIIGNKKKNKGAATMTLTTRNTTLQAVNGIDALEARFIDFLDKKPRTIETYRKALKPFINYLADRGIRNPQRSDIIAYRNMLAETLKPSTIRTYLTVVKKFFAWTVEENLYPSNPAKDITGPQLTKAHKKDALTAHQAKAILAGIDTSTLQGKRDYAIMALMTGGGLRCIEVTRANIEDLANAGDSPVLYLQGKGRDEKAEYVKLAGPVEKAIREYLKARGKAAASGPLFASTSNNNQGQRMTTRTISGIIKGHMRAAGYDSERLTAHSLRHTAATLALMGGATIQEAQQMLRHSNINTTMLYSHNLTRAANTSEARIAEAIF